MIEQHGVVENTGQNQTSCLQRSAPSHIVDVDATFAKPRVVCSKLTGDRVIINGMTFVFCNVNNDFLFPSEIHRIVGNKECYFHVTAQFPADRHDRGHQLSRDIIAVTSIRDLLAVNTRDECYLHGNDILESEVASFIDLTQRDIPGELVGDCCGCYTRLLTQTKHPWRIYSKLNPHVASSIEGAYIACIDRSIYEGCSLFTTFDSTF